MNDFPFFTSNASLILLRIALAIIFLSHSIVRIANATIGQFADFLESKGFSFGIGWVWAITVFELGGGILLASGVFKKWISAGFIFMLIVGIILIHADLGWFVGEHGTGGSEYSFILIAALLTVAASDSKHDLPK